MMVSVWICRWLATAILSASLWWTAIFPEPAGIGSDLLAPAAAALESAPLYDWLKLSVIESRFPELLPGNNRGTEVPADRPKSVGRAVADVPDSTHDQGTQ